MPWFRVTFAVEVDEEEEIDRLDENAVSQALPGRGAYLVLIEEQPPPITEALKAQWRRLRGKDES